MMMKLPPKPVTREVTCELSGNPPELSLTLQPATELWIGEGIWSLKVLTEQGDSNITFELINKTGKCYICQYFFLLSLSLK